MPRDRAVLLDHVCKRYGRLPSEVRDRSIDDLLFDIHVAMAGVEAENEKR